jgi:hypothetical protein
MTTSGPTSKPPVNDLFSGARSKVKWAEQHMARLHDTVVQFLGSGSYKVSIKDDPETQSRFYEIVQTKPLPESLPFLIGDTIHCLRSALDHVTYEIVERGNRVPSQGLIFPIKDTRSEVVDAMKTEIQAAAGSDIVSLIVDGIQPHRGGHRHGHYLWVLHRLDCVDKHRKLLTAVEDIGFHHIEAVDEEGTTYTGLTLTSVGRRELQWPDYVKGKKLYLKNDGQLNFAIQFHEVEVAEGESVQPLLSRLKGAVVTTIDTIAEAY